jgi:predicted phosphodiesterase
MIDILFTDTHFGWKNNSMTWLNSQMDFIYKQFIPTIKRLKIENPKSLVRVIHLGDVFDSRSTISTLVATKVVEAFKNIRSVCDEFVIVCGNHDFYSPNSDEINTVSLFMNNLDIDIVYKDVLERDGHAYIPWYKWIDRENLNISEGYIFCHGDILNEKMPTWCIGRTIFSGHIHTPGEGPGLFNLGSCYSLNFSDANSTRGFYVIKDGKVIFVPNEVSIRFHRIRGKDVLNIPEYFEEDYIELYVPQEDLSKQEYIDAIKEYSSRYRHLWVIPVVSTVLNGETYQFEHYDITTIIDELIPEDLKHLYKQVKNKLKL